MEYAAASPARHRPHRLTNTDGYGQFKVDGAAIPGAITEGVTPDGPDAAGGAVENWPRPSAPARHKHAGVLGRAFRSVVAATSCGCASIAMHWFNPVPCTMSDFECRG